MINLFTRTRPAPVVTRIRRPRFELALGLAFVTAQILFSCAFWQVPTLSAVDRIALLPVEAVWSNLEKWRGPVWIARELNNATYSTAIMTVPVIALFLCQGYGRRAMGLRVRGLLPLTVTLVGIMAALGAAVGDPVEHNPIHLVLLTLVWALVNAVPEELAYRGYLLPRLEAVLKDPLAALVLSALVFNAVHIPSHIAQGASPPRRRAGCLHGGRADRARLGVPLSQDPQCRARHGVACVQQHHRHHVLPAVAGGCHPAFRYPAAALDFHGVEMQP